MRSWVLVGSGRRLGVENLGVFPLKSSTSSAPAHKGSLLPDIPKPTGMGLCTTSEWQVLLNSAKRGCGEISECVERHPAALDPRLAEQATGVLLPELGSKDRRPEKAWQ